MTRARCVCAFTGLDKRFDEIRHAVLVSNRDAFALRTEILAMRSRVLQAHPIAADRFDVKHSAGGMMDVEFAVQYLVLSQAAAHPSLALNSGNIALLRAAEEASLLPKGIGEKAADAYSELRSAQHLARLDEQTPQISLDALRNEKSAVKALWEAVFGSAPRGFTP